MKINESAGMNTTKSERSHAGLLAREAVQIVKLWKAFSGLKATTASAGAILDLKQGGNGMQIPSLLYGIPPRFGLS
jgi:hypothetical protein